MQNKREKTLLSAGSGSGTAGQAACKRKVIEMCPGGSLFPLLSIIGVAFDAVKSRKSNDPDKFSVLMEVFFYPRSDINGNVFFEDVASTIRSHVPNNNLTEYIGFVNHEMTRISNRLTVLINNRQQSAGLDELCVKRGVDSTIILSFAAGFLADQIFQCDRVMDILFAIARKGAASMTTNAITFVEEATLDFLQFKQEIILSTGGVKAVESTIRALLDSRLFISMDAFFAHIVQLHALGNKPAFSDFTDDMLLSCLVTPTMNLTLATRLILPSSYNTVSNPNLAIAVPSLGNVHLAFANHVQSSTKEAGIFETTRPHSYFEGRNKIFHNPRSSSNFMKFYYHDGFLDGRLIETDSNWVAMDYTECLLASCIIDLMVMLFCDVGKRKRPMAISFAPLIMGITSKTIEDMSKWSEKMFGLYLHLMRTMDISVFSPYMGDHIDSYGPFACWMILSRWIDRANVARRYYSITPKGYVAIHVNAALASCICMYYDNFDGVIIVS